MDISKALLEKYERGLCSDEERAAVQKWLESDSWDDFDDGVVSQTAKADIWRNVTGEIDTPQIIPHKVERLPKIHWAVYTSAACLLMLFIGFSVFHWFHSHESVDDFYANRSKKTLTWQHEQSFALLLSENSSAHIDLKSESISLSGNMMFIPKQNFTLRDSRNNRVFHFKRDQTYFLSEYPNERKFIVLQKEEIAFLPPPIQRRLKKQFHIS